MSVRGWRDVVWDLRWKAQSLEVCTFNDAWFRSASNRALRRSFNEYLLDQRRRQLRTSSALIESASAHLDSGHFRVFHESVWAVSDSMREDEAAMFRIWRGIKAAELWAEASRIYAKHTAA